MPSSRPAPPGTGRPTRAEIDPGAFRANVALAARYAGPDKEVMAVIKADAYGHGARVLAAEAQTAGAVMLGVATADEARDLEGAALPVIILSEVRPGEAADVVALGCRQVVYTRELADALEREARAQGRSVKVHLKADTGMGRVGAAPGDVAAMVEHIVGLSRLELEGFMTHLPEADSPGGGRTDRQVEEFLRLAGEVRGSAPGLRYVHTANSALLMSGKAVGNLVRPGIMLYGAPPAPDFPGAGELRPVMRFVTAVSFVKTVPAGTPLSYGGTFVTERESVIATLPVGYADGYPRLLSNNADVLIRGRRVPQVGRVCMDMILADVTGVPGVTAGDEAVLMGSQGDATVSADELALKTGTISYEIFCGVSSRVPRVYLSGGGES